MDLINIAYYLVRYANVWCLLAIVETVFVMLTTKSNYTVKRNVKVAVNKTGLLIIFAAVADMFSYYGYGIPGNQYWVFIGYFIVYQVPVLVPVIYCDALNPAFGKSHLGILIRFTAFIYGVSMVLNFFYPIYFYINENAVYMQKDFWFIRPLVVVIIYFVIFSNVLLDKYALTKTEVNTFNYVLVLFIIGVLYTDFFYAGQIIELVLASGFSFMTRMFQNLELKTDPVTRLSNRVVYTEEAFENKDSSDLVVVSIDINNSNFPHK